MYELEDEVLEMNAGILLREEARAAAFWEAYCSVLKCSSIEEALEVLRLKAENSRG